MPPVSGPSDIDGPNDDFAARGGREVILMILMILLALEANCCVLPIESAVPHALYIY